MDELTNSKLRKPLDKSNMGGDVASLKQLIGLMNNPLITGADVPPEAQQQINAVFNSEAVKPFVQNNLSPTSTAPSPTTERAVSASVPPNVIDNPVSLGRKIFFTGRLCAGKDFTAAYIGANVFGFADPIYALTEYLHNVKVTATQGKDLPGIRQFLQTVGQWGRNEVNTKYPLNAERAMFCMMIRSLASHNCLMSEGLHLGVDWGMFGLTPDLWIDGLLKRVEVAPEGQRIAVTNCRFANEYKRLVAAGWQHWHIICSPQQWLARLAILNLDANSPTVSDMSERLAIDLNADLTRKLSANKNGNKMRVVWSDPSSSPSNRIYSLAEFKSMSNN